MLMRAHRDSARFGDVRVDGREEEGPVDDRERSDHDGGDGGDRVQLVVVDADEASEEEVGGLGGVPLVEGEEEDAEAEPEREDGADRAVALASAEGRRRREPRRRAREPPTMPSTGSIPITSAAAAPVKPSSETACTAKLRPRATTNVPIAPLGDRQRSHRRTGRCGRSAGRAVAAALSGGGRLSPASRRRSLGRARAGRRSVSGRGGRASHSVSTSSAGRLPGRPPGRGHGPHGGGAG